MGGPAPLAGPAGGFGAPLGGGGAPAAPFGGFGGGFGSPSPYGGGAPGFGAAPMGGPAPFGGAAAPGGFPQPGAGGFAQPPTGYGAAPPVQAPMVAAQALSLEQIACIQAEIDVDPSRAPAVFASNGISAGDYERQFGQLTATLAVDEHKAQRFEQLRTYYRAVVGPRR